MLLIIDGILDTTMKHICALHLIAISSLLSCYMNLILSEVIQTKKRSIKGYEHDKASNNNLNMVSLPNNDE